MAKAIHQFRFYTDSGTESRNEPSGKDYVSAGGMEAFSKGTLFDGSVEGSTKYIPILQLGIQTIPGTRFYLNDGVDPIIIGSTGIYELDMDNGVEVSKLTIDIDSLKKISEMQNGYLIIDIIYEKEED
jgi:hypothetical protein